MRSLLVLSLLLASTAFAFRPGPSQPHRPPITTPKPAPAEPQKLQVGHLDFETMNVTGNTLGPNGVQLRDRKLLTHKSMVKTPDNFRQALYDDR
jgi:hypothetical protein